MRNSFENRVPLKWEFRLKELLLRADCQKLDWMVYVEQKEYFELFNSFTFEDVVFPVLDIHPSAANENAALQMRLFN